MLTEAAVIMNFRTSFSTVLKTVLPVVVISLSFGACKKPSLPNSSKEVAAAPVVPPPVEEPAAPPPPPSKVHQVDTKGSVIVLCYHRFEEKPKDGLAITPAAFESQMQALADHGFSVIGMQDFLAWRRGEKSIPEKSCVITIDDGYRSGYDVAWPILKKHGYPFTMFVYTAFVKGGALAGGGSLSWGELAEMRDAGVDIQSHTVNHQSLRVKKGKFQSQFPTYEEWLKNELAGSKRQIEAQLGISVQAVAYPYGIHSELIRAIAMEAGYEAAFSTYGQRLGYHSPADQLGRYAVESTKPKIFSDALAMVGGGGGGGMAESAAGVTGQLAAVSMITVPNEGETVHETKPAIKANLATMGDVEPGTVEIRISGVGAVPVKYDPATKLAEAVLLQPLKDKQVTVLLSAQVRGRKVETRWNFVCDAVQASAAPVHGTAVPVNLPGAAPAPVSAPPAGAPAGPGASAPSSAPIAPAPLGRGKAAETQGAPAAVSGGVIPR
jgi:peptidoglycan/xylan/chitin deacetylase (PgdA/CDA1 family)